MAGAATVGDQLSRVSVILPVGTNPSPCGYCKRGTHASYGASATHLTTLDYQALMDAGWRRSGTWLYHPDNTPPCCCPSHTIRLDATAFRATRDQRRIVTRFNRWLRGEVDFAGDGGSGGSAGAGATSGKGGTSGKAAAGAGGAAPRSLRPAALALHELVVRAAAAAWDVGAAAPPPPPGGTGCWTQATVRGPPNSFITTLPRAMAPIAGVPPAAAADTLARAITAAWCAGVGDGAAAADGSSGGGAVVGGFSTTVAGVGGVSLAGKLRVGPFPKGEGVLELALEECEVAVDGAPWHPPAVATEAKAARGTPRTAGSGAATAPAVKRGGRGAAAAAGAAAAGAGAGRRPHTFEVEVVPAAFSEAVYGVFRTYQQKVHKEPAGKVTREHFTSFLCESPLIPETWPPRQSPAASLPWRPAGRAASRVVDPPAASHPCAAALSRSLAGDKRGWDEGEGSGVGVPCVAEGARAGDAAFEAAARERFKAAVLASFATTDADVLFPDLLTAPAALPSHGYGSFHHIYRIDGAVVGLGVVDVTPLCLSSVYLAYDASQPVLKRLEFGKLTALREIQWVQAAAQWSPRLRHYYLGLYIHEARKMRYKADFAPCELRCAATGAWVPASAAVPLLAADKYAVLAVPAAAAAVGAGGGAGAGGEVPAATVGKAAAARSAAALTGGCIAISDLAPASLIPIRSVPAALTARGVEVVLARVRELAAHIPPHLAERLVLYVR